jgi:rubrerythrin
MREIFALEDIFNVMIELETLGNVHYVEMQDMTDDLQLKALFGLLATQEMAHKELYTKYKNMNITFERNLVTEEYEDYMDAMLKGTVRFLEQSKEIKNFEHGFEVAINLEKDTILFLTELRRIIAPEYHAAIDNVTDQERNHLKALYDYKSKF